MSAAGVCIEEGICIEGVSAWVSAGGVCLGLFAWGSGVSVWGCLPKGVFAKGLYTWR